MSHIGKEMLYMQRKSVIQNVTIIVLAVAIIMMSVGYAVYGADLQITGTTTIEKASWDIKFTNIQELSTNTVDSTNVTAPSLTDTTHLTFGVKMALNTTYEFTVDVANEGTIPAELSTFTLTGTKGNDTVLNASSGLSYSSNYLTYVVEYADGTKLTAGDELGAGESVTLKVSVKYTQPTSAEQLPTANESYLFTLDLAYAQA